MKTRPMVVGGLVVATLVGATLVSRQFFEGPARDNAAPPIPTASAGPTPFRVSALEGTVEALHDGQWYAVQAGDLLSLRDVIRTSKGAKAVLRRGSSEIELRENVDIRLDDLAASTARFGLLRGGNVVASVGREDQHLEITAAETRSRNQGTARWIVSANAQGQVSVAASEGKVAFTAKGKEVTVPAGTESTAAPGQPPGTPTPIPEELLLSVVWPDKQHTDGRTEVAGQVSPSSKVTVNGAEVPVENDGRFSSTLPLGVGANRVQVEALDIKGRKKAETRVLQRNAPSPTLVPTGEEIWKK